jgi:hypothetical protein
MSRDMNEYSIGTYFHNLPVDTHSAIGSKRGS